MDDGSLTKRVDATLASFMERGLMLTARRHVPQSRAPRVRRRPAGRGLKQPRRLRKRRFGPESLEHAAGTLQRGSRSVGSPERQQTAPLTEERLRRFVDCSEGAPAYGGLAVLRGRLLVQAVVLGSERAEQHACIAVERPACDRPGREPVSQIEIAELGCRPQFGWQGEADLGGALGSTHAPRLCGVSSPRASSCSAERQLHARHCVEDLDLIREIGELPAAGPGHEALGVGAARLATGREDPGNRRTDAGEVDDLASSRERSVNLPCQDQGSVPFASPSQIGGLGSACRPS